jgi:hypothetical protein
MKKRWMGPALAMCYFGLAAAVQAQFAPAGRATMPEPTPLANAIVPMSDLGAPPLGPGFAPPGLNAPPPGTPYPFGAPSNMPGAFPDQAGAQGPRGIYAHIGAMALLRQRFGNGIIALEDNASHGLDTGTPPPANSTPVLNFNNINPQYQWGERFTLGILETDHAIEFSGFYLQDARNSATAISPGRLSSFLFNPPVGFEGDDGMWLQADIMTATVQTAIGSAEINYRWWNNSCWGVEWIAGIRYVNLQESASIFTDDDALVRPDRFGRPDPLRQATYLVRSINQFVGPQLGVEWTRPCLSWVTFGANAKGAMGPNFVSIDRRLTRGDGFVGFSKNASETTYSSVWEAGIFADLSVFERVRVRVGYEALLFAHVPDAQSQVQFDLRTQTGVNNNGTIFYSGPIMELQFLF